MIWDTSSQTRDKYSSRTDIRFHDLRHTFATILLEAGENIKVVSEMLGHSSVEVTMNIYCHVSSEMQGKAANKIEHALSGM